MSTTTTIKVLLGQMDRGAWVRFFIAIAGLMTAFAAAMFSTIFREAGNEIATFIAASLALIVAGTVAIYTVPYLAKRVALEGISESFDYDLTKEGMVYLGVALLIGVAALTSANNLLFIVVAAMLAGILVSGVASAVVLRGLKLEASLPVHVFARQEVMARIHVRNGYRVPSFSVSVVPPRAKNAKRFRWEHRVFGFPSKRAKEQQWFRIPDMYLRLVDRPRAVDAIFQSSVYFPYIPGHGAAHADVALKFPHRGRFVQEGFGISTRFPFSFLRKTRRMPLEKEIIVYPTVEPTAEFFQVLPMITGECEAFVSGRGYDLYRIREHQPGDSARHVDWKATAKSTTLKVREFTREDERKLRIVFDNPTPGRLGKDDYENAVALAASLAWYFSGTNAQLSFMAQGCVSQAEIFEFLKYLAIVQPAEGASLLPELKATRDYNIIITAQPRGSLPMALWASSYIVFLENVIHENVFLENLAN